MIRNITEWILRWDNLVDSLLENGQGFSTKEMKELSLLLKVAHEAIVFDSARFSKKTAFLREYLYNSDLTVFTHKLDDPGDEEDVWEVRCDPRRDRMTKNALSAKWGKITTKIAEVTCPLCRK